MSRVQTIDSPLTLLTSGRYANPENNNDVLPIAYGAMVGKRVAPCIDTQLFIYCFAAHSCLSIADGNVLTIEDDNGIRTDATFFNAIDFQGLGVIAMIQLLSAASGDLLVSGKGKIDDTGELIENPVSIVRDLIASVDIDLDLTSFAFAEQMSREAGYVAAGVILKEQKYTFWLTAILVSFLGSWWIQNDGTLTIQFDFGSLANFQVSGFLVERKGITVDGTISLQNIVNQAILDYQLSYSASDKRYKEGVVSNFLQHDDGEASKDFQSQLFYGIQKRIFELDWIQDSLVASTIQGILIEKFKEITWLINWTEYDFMNIHVEVGDYVVYSWEERIDENGDPLVNQIAQVLSKNVALDEERIQFELIDLNIPLSALPDKWDGTVNTGDGGHFGIDRDTRRLT